ncbi:hypothetical protein KBX37_31135 [Micromonospora sp. U56]|uniref:hypothetical protein n=1 Tax=Micromonospora sp. U56 TaxID=2824900 RepID=UPI001B35F635|nr:hypothetical protein [Micromonospora sp. U56]MBQ0897466.1 hypothetical protein [Micromonospora sp. U56]
MVVHSCTERQEQGSVDRYSSNPGRKRAADMYAEEREAAAAERRDVIQSNKDWDSVQIIRREWLLTFMTRPAAPQGRRHVYRRQPGPRRLPHH